MMIRLGMIGLLFTLVAFHSRQLAADEDFEGTPAEKELISLLNSIDEKYSTYWQESRALEDPDQQAKFLKANDPALECVPTLLAFEEQHRGTIVGLMALRRIINMTARSGRIYIPRVQGRREVLERLSNYADRPELLVLLSSLGNGIFEPRIADTLRTLIEDESADPLVREYSKLTIGRGMLKAREGRELCERRLGALRNGVAPYSPTEKQALEERLEALPVAAITQAWQNEAVEMLREVAESTQELFLPEFEKVDPDGHLLRVVENSAVEKHRLSDSAKGLLFKESHLRLGKIAPDLEVELLTGENWSMAEQRGKAVIIQFSFKGCGPCERMYPILRELQQQYGERLSILSVMADKERSDVEESVAAGSLTWQVHWDGHRGPIGTRWAVRGFPTVYIVDPQGKIAGFKLRGEELKNKIAELLN